ncbi:hypothetical protein B484DRAFT_479253 [Ochromonadaceae sp. CCMP2298]|nr:hypothetical protein B484DRAFT_479253 [Ochromonadaceae sp. CCMP2298]
MEHQDFETTQAFPAEVGLEDSTITSPWQSPSGNSYEQPSKVEEIMSEFNAELQYVIEQGQTRVGDIYNEYMTLKREIAELDADIRQEKRCMKKRKEHTAGILDRACSKLRAIVEDSEDEDEDEDEDAITARTLNQSWGDQESQDEEL